MKTATYTVNAIDPYSSRMAMQQALFTEEEAYLDSAGGVVAEDPEYLTEQLITYIGNKRALLPQIEIAIHQVRERVDGRRLRVVDAFAGSGIVSRYLKRHADVLHSNDFETYARVIGEAFLTNRSDVNLPELARIAADMNARYESGYRIDGFFADLYAPKENDNVQPGERCFYSTDNAVRLDTFRALLDEIPQPQRTLLLAPLLAETSVHVNTGGVFKGFYKDRQGIGKFGGEAGNALQRILAPIQMAPPILSRYECDSFVHQTDANALVREVTDVDVMYLDPPYNQHPYGSNYFMLNLLVSNERPDEVSKVSGIPTDWQRSEYNKRQKAFDAFRDLTEAASARFLLISYSDEGFIPPDAMRELLHSQGMVQEIQTPYSTYRASRNLGERSLQVTEHLYLVDRDRGTNG